MSAKTDCNRARPLPEPRDGLAVRGGTAEGRTQLAGRILALLPEDFRVLVVEGDPQGEELESGDGRGYIRHLRHSSEGWILQHHGPPPFRQQQLLNGEADLILRLRAEEGTEGEHGFATLVDGQDTELAREDEADPALRQALAHWLAREENRSPLAGLVLAGGRSRRMGRDKAQLVYREKPQQQAAFELLAGVCDKVYLGLRADQEAGGLPVIHDRFLDFGPAGGILSAMHQLPDHAWLVLACDLPFLEAATLETLLEQRVTQKAATAFRSATDGLPEPLCAIWEPAMLPVLHRFLAAGISCPRKMLIKSSVRLLDLPQAEALDNINHPDEYEKARQRLEGGPR